MLMGTHANVFLLVSVCTNTLAWIHLALAKCPHNTHLFKKHQRPKHSLTPSTSLFVLNKLKTSLENNLFTDPDFQHHSGAFKAHFILGCQLLSANSKPSLILKFMRIHE
jgi:hypothetical protein